MTPLIRLSGLLALALVGSLAWAQEPPPRDTGVTSPEEAVARIQEALGASAAVPLVAIRLPLEWEAEIAGRTEAPGGPQAMAWHYLAVRMDPDRPLAVRQTAALEQGLRSPGDSFLAAAGLAWMGDWTPAVRERLLRAALEEGTTSQREEALNLIGSLGAAGEDLLPPLLKEYFAEERAGEWDRLPPMTTAIWEILNALPEIPPLEVPSLAHENAVRGVWLLSIEAEKGVDRDKARQRLLAMALAEEPASGGARTAAIRAIPQAFDDDREALEILAGMLRRRRMQPLLDTVVAAIGEYGPVAEDYAQDLWPLIDSDDEQLRAETAAALFRICPTDGVALTLVIEMPEAQFGHFRSLVLGQFAATYLEDSQIRDMLRQTLQSLPLESEATLGAMSLRQRPQPDLVPDLMRLLERRSRTPREIELAADMVARWDPEGGLPLLLDLIESTSDWQARRALLGIVGRFDSPGVEEVLMDARRDPSPYVRRTALEALAQRPYRAR